MKTAALDAEAKAFLRKELEEYLEPAVSMTGDEKTELIEWVTSGNSPYDNPYTLYDDSGCLMDFLKGLRIGNDMQESLSDYSWGKPAAPDGSCSCAPF